MKFRALLLQLEEREITFPDGHGAHWEIASYPGHATAVAALGFLPATQELVMIRNYRPSIGEWLLEVAGGVPYAAESLPDAARREFEEETGFLVERLIAGPTLYSLPGVGHFPIACFVAEAAHQRRQQLEPSERIVPERIAATAEGIAAAKREVREPVSLALLDFFLRSGLHSPRT